MNIRAFKYLNNYIYYQQNHSQNNMSIYYLVHDLNRDTSSSSNKDL